LAEHGTIIETFAEMATRYEKLMNSELKRFWGIDYYSFISKVLGEIKIIDSNRIIDIATGTAFIPRSIIEANARYSHIVGLDITLEMLRNGQKIIAESGANDTVDLVCASAHEMPFKAGSFDLAICCLATHHMSVDELLSEIYFSLKPGGVFHIGDVGGSARWKIGFIRTVIKVLAFIYFFFTENLSRAKAEAEAVANVMTSDEWFERISDKGFKDIEIHEIQSSKFWTPNPIILTARKALEEKA